VLLDHVSGGSERQPVVAYLWIEEKRGLNLSVNLHSVRLTHNSDNYDRKINIIYTEMVIEISPKSDYAADDLGYTDGSLTRSSTSGARSVATNG